MTRNSQSALARELRQNKFNEPRPTQGTATIIIHDFWAETSADYFDLLRPLLVRRGKVVAYSGGEFAVRTLHEKCFEITPPGTLWIPAGVVPAAEKVLMHHGIVVEVRDEREHNSHTIGDDQWMLTLPAPMQHYLGQIARHRRALVAYAQQDRQFQLELLVRYYDQARTLVLAANLDEVWSVTAALRGSVNQLVQTHRDFAADGLGRVVVAPVASFERINPAQFDMMIFLDGRHVLAAERQPMIERMALRNCYAFCPDYARYLPRELFRLRVLIGPTIIPLPRPPIVVQGLTTTTSMVSARFATALDRKRALYWQHDARNDYLAQVASALRSGEIPVLAHKQPGRPDSNQGLTTTTSMVSARFATALDRKRALYWQHDARNDYLAQVASALRSGEIPVLAHKQPGRPDSNPVAPSSVILIVESPDHARELRKRLPDWVVQARCPMPDIQPVPSSGRTIMTQMCALQYASLEADVVIWAGGGEPRVALPHLTPLSGGPLTVIDLVDTFDRGALAASRQRIQDYATRGWQVILPT